jgi:hypothetical protein
MSAAAAVKCSPTAGAESKPRRRYRSRARADTTGATHGYARNGAVADAPGSFQRVRDCNGALRRFDPDRVARLTLTGTVLGTGFGIGFFLLVLLLEVL